MKKLTLSVAALSIALNINAQSAYFDTTISTIVTNEATIAENNHKNLYEIVIRAEDMRNMLEKDVDSGYIYKQYAEFYDYLLADIIKLASTTKLED